MCVFNPAELYCFVCAVCTPPQKLMSGQLDATLLNPPFTSMLSPGIPAQPLYALIGPYEGVGGNVNKRWLGVDDTSSKAKGRAAKVAKAKRKAANRKALAKLLSLLCGMLFSQDYQLLPRLAGLVAQVVAAAPAALQPSLLQHLLNALLNSDDYARRPQLTAWMHSLLSRHSRAGSLSVTFL